MSGDSVLDNGNGRAAGDSAIIGAENQQGLLEVYQIGKVTVVGFGGHDVPEDYNVATYRDQIIELIKEHACEEFAFDLSGVKLVPSGILGLIASIRNQNVKVAVYNPSEDVRDVFATTHLDQLVDVRQVNL